MTRKDFIKMSTAYSSEELIAAKELRTISQKDLLDKIEKHEKLGLIIRDQLSITMLRQGVYEQMINELDEYRKRIEALEEILEDVELSKKYSSRLDLPESEWIEIPENMNLKDFYSARKQQKEQ